MFKNVKKTLPVAFFIIMPIIIAIPFSSILIQKMDMVHIVLDIQLFVETIVLSVLFLSHHHSFAYNPRSSSFFIPILILCEQVIIFLSLDSMRDNNVINLNISSMLHIFCYVFGMLMLIGYGLFYQMNDSKVVYRFCILGFIGSIAVAAYTPFTITTTGVVIDPVITVLFYILTLGAIFQYSALIFTDPPGQLVNRDIAMIFFAISLGIDFIGNAYTGILSSAISTVVSLGAVIAIRMNWFVL